MMIENINVQSILAALEAAKRCTCGRVNQLKAALSQDRCSVSASGSLDQRRLVAQLSYRVQALTHKNESMKFTCDQIRESNIEESLIEDETEKIDSAVKAAKQGATPRQISEQFGFSEGESILIVTLQGKRRTRSLD